MTETLKTENLPKPLLDTREVAILDSKNRSNLIQEVRKEMLLDKGMYPYFAKVKVLPDLDNSLGFTVITEGDTHIRFQITSLSGSTLGRGARPEIIIVTSMGNFGSGKSLGIMSRLSREEFFEYIRFITNMDALVSSMRKEKKTIEYRHDSFSLEDNTGRTLVNLSMVNLPKRQIIQTLQIFFSVNSKTDELPTGYQGEKV